MANTEKKITDARAEILQCLTDCAAEISKLVELERTGVHADKNGISNAGVIDYLGKQITELAGELSDLIFREERPAEYAQQQAALEKWRNDPENRLPF
jgi:hypothetical protein